MASKVSVNILLCCSLLKLKLGGAAFFPSFLCVCGDFSLRLENQLNSCHQVMTWHGLVWAKGIPLLT